MLYMNIKISSILDTIADRLEAKGLIKEAFNLDLLANTLDTDYDKIEKQLEDAYNRHAPQSQINHLETELSKLVSEGGHDISEEDLLVNTPATSEGYVIDEELRDLYHQYLNADDPGSIYTRQELIKIMRGAINEGDHGQRPVEGLTDAQILDAAKDAYEHKMKLTQRRNAPNRVNKTPEEALQGLAQIKKKLNEKSHFKI
jgi:hypothetical protein